MLPEIRLSISKNDEVIQTITTNVDRHRLVDSLVEFQAKVNAVITKMIEEHHDTSGDCNTDNEDEDGGEEDIDEEYSAKKKKK